MAPKPNGEQVGGTSSKETWWGGLSRPPARTDDSRSRAADVLCVMAWPGGCFWYRYTGQRPSTWELGKRNITCGALAGTGLALTPALAPATPPPRYTSVSLFTTYMTNPA